MSESPAADIQQGGTFGACRLLPALILSCVLAGTLFLLASVARADAGDGEYLGFQLGEIYEANRKAKPRPHIRGLLIYDLDAGRSQEHLQSIKLFTSPVSLIVGGVFGEWYFDNERTAEFFADNFIVSLQNAYPSWRRTGRSLSNGTYQVWSSWEQRPPIVEHWPSRKRYRVTTALVFDPDSVDRQRWMTLVEDEQGDKKMIASQR